MRGLKGAEIRAVVKFKPPGLNTFQITDFPVCPAIAQALHNMIDGCGPGMYVIYHYRFDPFPAQIAQRIHAGNKMQIGVLLT